MLKRFTISAALFLFSLPLHAGKAIYDLTIDDKTKTMVTSFIQNLDVNDLVTLGKFLGIAKNNLGNKNDLNIGDTLHFTDENVAVSIKKSLLTMKNLGLIDADGNINKDVIKLIILAAKVKDKLKAPTDDSQVPADNNRGCCNLL